MFLNAMMITGLSLYYYYYCYNYSSVARKK